MSKIDNLEPIFGFPERFTAYTNSGLIGLIGLNGLKSALIGLGQTSAKLHEEIRARREIEAFPVCNY